MATNYLHSGKRVTAIAGTGGTTSGYMVKLSSNTVVAATDGAGIWGVALATSLATENVSVARSGVFSFSAATGVDFGFGDVAYVATASTLDAGSITNISCGVVVDTDPASAGTVHLQITPSDFNVTTTHA